MTVKGVIKIASIIFNGARTKVVYKILLMILGVFFENGIKNISEKVLKNQTVK